MICNSRLNGKNLYLRSLNKNDNYNLYFSWLNDSEINKFLEIRYNLPSDKSTLIDYIDQQNKSLNSIFFGIFKNNSKFIGTLRLHNINSHHNTCELGFIIGDKSEHKKGHAYDALNCAIKYAKQNLGVRKIYAGCYSENTTSSKLLLKIGFTLTATLEKHWIFNKKFNDQLIYQKFI